MLLGLACHLSEWESVSHMRVRKNLIISLVVAYLVCFLILEIALSPVTVGGEKRCVRVGSSAMESTNMCTLPETFR